MTSSRNLACALLLSVYALAARNAAAQPSFELSSKFYEADFSQAPAWDGTHRFDNVFCLTFPRSQSAQGLAYALYNNNTLYFSRVAYPDLTALYVVTSTLPAGRTAEAEIDALAAQNQRSVEAYPAYFKQTRTTGTLGPSLTLTMRNAQEGGKEAPFPFVRTFANRPDGLLGSLSVHRLFVHGQDRIEVAGLRYFKTPVRADHETEAITDLSTLVDAAADAMQSCTAKLPPRVQ